MCNERCWYSSSKTSTVLSPPNNPMVRFSVPRLCQIGLPIYFQKSCNQDHPSTYGMSPTGGVQGVFGNSDGMNEVDLAMTDGIRNGTNETARSSYRMDWPVDLETCTASDSLQQMVVESSSMHNGMADQTVA